MITQFMIDGLSYNVQVMSLTRSFEVKDAIRASETQDGNIYRDPVGTYYSYSMTVREKDGDRNAFDAFWDVISKPTASHVCVFPFNQTMLTQKMYVTSGSQPIERLYEDGARWSDITVQFIAQAPKVLA